MDSPRRNPVRGRRRRKRTSEELREPKVWGPVFWETYDIIANTYPIHPSRQERRAARLFFRSQKYIIPCETCSENYRAIYKLNPPRVESRESLQQWLAKLKSDVAKHTKK